MPEKMRIRYLEFFPKFLPCFLSESRRKNHRDFPVQLLFSERVLVRFWVYMEVDKSGEDLVKDLENSLPSLLVAINDIFFKLEASIGHFHANCQSGSSVDGSFYVPLMFTKIPEVNQEGSQWTDCETRDAINLIY